MLYFFPIPYPDELFYSMVCRYHVRSGNRSFRQTQLDLFETAGTKQYYLGLPNNLATLINQLPFGSSLTLNQLLEKHTLFPYYQTFLTNREVKRLRELMEGKESKSIAQVAKIPKLKLYYPDYLRFCPQCLAEDLQQYGETYWHLEHQFPGIKVCLNHRVGLQNSRVLVEEMGKGFMAADEENCVGDGVSYDGEVLQGLWVFGKVIEGKMRERRGFKGLEGLRDEYKQGLMKLGLLEEERLVAAMLERYGEGVLRLIHPEMMENLGEYVSGCLLGCDLLQEVDRVVHWFVEGIILT
ncbi:Tn7-like transposition protein D [Gloeothece citriformis PCC 7424]|uniref:Tn7-like transposition protein D n=1 Tax=Gloeothece citriformis (strain PCC 7424) TaxID=65393 RepID=B7KHQ0_GLOC7|nr:TniQ family protein [Gloeothece citriformis]ACK70745.1 Tn7-like transposition protein D [Gloeothece citriformis PCC 7424]